MALNGKTSHFVQPRSPSEWVVLPLWILSHPGSVKGYHYFHCTNEATEAQRGRCLTQSYKARQVAGWGPSRAFLPPSPTSPELPAQGFVRHMEAGQGKPPSSQIIGLNGRSLQEGCHLRHGDPTSTPWWLLQLVLPSLCAHSPDPIRN